MPSLTDSSALIPGGLYLALLLLVGYAVLAIAIGKDERHWLELLALSFSLGIGTVSTVLFVCSVAGWVSNRNILIAFGCIAMLAIAIKRKSLPRPSLPEPRGRFDSRTVFGLAGLALILSSASNVIARTRWPGLCDIDAFAIWMFKAKVLALQPLRPLPIAFRAPTLSYSHQDYPLSLPFLVAGLYAALGHINDEQAKLLLLPIYLSLIGLMYASLRRLHRRAIALAITAIFAASPTLTQNASLLVAETPLLLAWTACLTMLLRWTQTRQRGDLLLSALFMTFAAFTKNEGLGLFPLIFLAMLLITLTDRQPAGRKHWGTAAITALLVLAPWLIFRTFLPKTHENYGGKLTDPQMVMHNLNRVGFIFSHFFSRVFDAPKVGLIWLVLIVIAIAGYRAFARRTVQIFWLVLIAQLALYTATFIVTPWDLRELIPMIGPKLLTQASPLAALLIGLHLQTIGFSKNQVSAGIFG